MSRVFSMIGIVFVAMAAWYFLAQGPFISAPESFAHEGNLIKGNPGLVPNTWYLSYEEPGASGLLMPLVFDSNSLCGIEGDLALCDMSFDQGQRVRVEGIVVSGSVSVTALRSIMEKNGVAVQLYYYNPERDKDETGNILCSPQGLVPVVRILPDDMMLPDVIEIHLRGALSAEERAQGVTSEFPLEGVSLADASLDDGIATLTINDPLNKTSGGSCRVSILRAQIEATAMQFPGVTEVRFEPVEVFQP